MARQLIGDAELLALASIVGVMADLDPATQGRVTEYLVSRYGTVDRLLTRPAVEVVDDAWGQGREQ
jgi:hypothetical protein